MASRVSRRVAMPLALVAGATILRWVLDPVLTDQLGSILFYAAVLFATWRWGWRCGALTGALSFVAAEPFIFRSLQQLTEPGRLAGAALFVAISTGIILCVEQGRTETRRGTAWWIRTLQILALTAAYYASARFGLTLAFFQSSASAVWPPTGIALAALLLFGSELWPGVWLGAFLGNLAVDQSIELAGTIAIGNTFEALIGMWLIRRFAGGWRAFDSWRGIREFFLVALLAAAISATNGTVALCVEGQAAWWSYHSVWLTWWLGDLCSAIMLTPLLVLWATKPVRIPEPSRSLEAGGLALLIGVVAMIQFGFMPAGLQSYPLTFLILPVLLVTAFRFGQRVTVTAAVVLNAVAIWGVLRSFGLQVTGDSNLTLFLLQLRILIVTGAAMFVAAAIAELRAAEVAVRESRKQEQKRRTELESLMEAVPAVVWVAHDPESRLITGNRTAHEFLRVEPGKNLSKTAPPGEAPQGFKVFKNGREVADAELPVQIVARSGRPIYGEELEERFEDGSVKWLYGNVVPLLDDDGQPRGAVATFIDVTALKQAEQALRSAKQQVGLILDSMTDGFVTFDVEWRYTYMNEPIARRISQLGKDPRATIGRTLWEEWPEIAQTEQADALCRAMRDRVPATFEYFFKPIDRWLQNRIYPTSGGGLAIFQTDITERKRGERRLAANLAITKILAESPELSVAMPRIIQTICEALDWSVGAYWAADTTSGVLRCEAFWRPAGSKVSEFESISRSGTFEPGIGMPGRVWSSQKPAWIPDVTKDNNFPRAPAAQREGLRAAFGFPIVSQTNFLGVMEFFSPEIREPDAELLRMFEALGTQIALFVERKRSDQAMAHLAAIIEASGDPIISKSLDGTVTSWNPAAAGLFGYSASEMVGHSIRRIIPPDRMAEEDAIVARLKAGESTEHHESIRITKDGRSLPVSITVSPIKDSAGKIVGASIVIRDITDRKLAEQALRESQERLALAVSGARVGLFDWNVETGKIWCSEQYERIFGLVGTTTTTMTMTTLSQPYSYGDWAERVHPDDLPRVEELLRRCTDERKPFETEYRIVWADGSLHWIATRGLPYDNEKNQAARMLGVVIDISDRKRREAELAELRDNLAAELYETRQLHSLSSHLLTKQELEPLLDHVLNASVELLGADKGLLHLYDEQTNSLRILSNVGFTPEILKNLDRVHKGAGPCGMAMERGERVIVEDVFAEPLFNDFRLIAEEGGFCAVQATPLFSSQRKLLGVLSTYFARKYRPSERVFQMLDLYADQAAALIERKLTEKQLRETNETLEVRVIERTAKLSRAYQELRQLIRERERLEREILDISEREQRRIGQELHDDLGQRLTGLMLMLNVLQRRLEKEKSDEADNVAKLHKLASETVKLTRDLSHGLCAPLVRPEGLNEALTELVQTVRDQARVECRFVPDSCSIDDSNVATQFYRIAQEAVTNAIKHASPSNIEVRLTTYADRPCLVVVDDGVGISPDAVASEGIGLRTMHYRARTMGASLSIERSPNGRGTLVRCWFGAPAAKEQLAVDPGLIS